MSEPAQTVDSLLASLVGMGFELDRCQAAVNCGKLTIHEAVEWLLQGHGADKEAIPSRSAPTLSLNQQPQARPSSGVAEAAAEANYLPPVPAPAGHPGGSGPPVSPTAGASLPAVPGADTGQFQQQDVVSRFSLSERKQQEKERWEKEQREKAATEARQARQQAKEARSYILKNIEADKEARHQLGKLPTNPKETRQQEGPMEVGPSTQTPTSASRPADNPTAREACQGEAGSQETKSSSPSKPAMCMLQIRLPSGQSKRETFCSSATLQSVVDHIRDQHAELTCIDVIQPFPHRLFTSTELGSSLEELKLTPSGNLVVKVATHTPPTASQQQQCHADQDRPSPCPNQDQHPQPPDEHALQQPALPAPMLPPPAGLAEVLRQRPPPPQPVSSIRYQWGRGNALSPDDPGGREEEEGEEPMEVGRAPVNRDDGPWAADEEEMEGEDEAGVGGAELDMLWGAPVLNRHLRDGRVGHDWGDGNRLIDGRRPLNFNYGFGGEGQRQDAVELHVPSPQRAAAAALSRLAVAASLNRPHSPASTCDKPITALMDLCLRCVSKRIEGRGAHHPLTTLEALPPHIAGRLVEELKGSGTLRPKTLNLFLPCHLQYLSLDCYKYATNELLQTVRLHVHISRLSLSSCQLLTDQGFLAINSLRKLQYLNVSNNKQLTDGILHSIKDLPNLVTLVLEGTSVSDKGISVLASSTMGQLTHLSLNRTNVSDSMLPFLTVFYNLKSLGVEQTKVVSLAGIKDLVSLHSLNIARNRLTAQALALLVRLPDLTAVNVMLLEELSGDEVLHHLQGLELKQLQMPDRHTTTNTGLCCIAGMPLVALDLSDYIHITDQGIHHIADMTSLTKLSLNNTKITDVALTYIQGLVELRELHLDRTAVSDVGAMAIGCLCKLEVLSMASTRIKNEFLRSKTLNRCQHLTRLNLSKTDVTNRGIEALQLPHLSLLNLDSTCVTVEGASRISGCPELKVVRTNNLRVDRGEEDE